MNDQEHPVGLRDRHDRDVVVAVEARALERQRKRATVRMVQPEGDEFTIVCDEGAYLGGAGSAPSPLAFFSASLAFWLLTQLSRYGAVLKLELGDLRLEVTTRFHIEGSVLRGTLASRPLGFETRLEVDSTEPPDRIAALVRTAERSCYVLQSLLRPVEVEASYLLNGEPFDPGSPAPL